MRSKKKVSEFLVKLERVYKTNIPGFDALLSADRLSAGASQETYRIVVKIKGKDVIHALRRSAGGVTREITSEHPGLEAEAMLMKAAVESNIPVPKVLHVMQESDGLGAGFIMEWLEGETLGARIVRHPSFESLRETLAAQCGRLLAKIHTIDLDSTQLRSVLAEITPVEIIQQTWSKYQELNSSQAMIDYTAIWLLNNLPENLSKNCLVHNDFRNGNIMVSPSEVVAVLDWELAYIGDPMRDLGWICVNSWRFGSNQPVGGFGEYEDLFIAYERESGQKVDRAAVKFWEVFGSFWWAIACLGMAEHYRTGPDKSVERPAIARRSSESQIDCVNLLIPGYVSDFPTDASSSDQIPTSIELLESVMVFLREEVMGETEGRTQFLARVSANSLDIVKRELQYGERSQSSEQKRLQEFYDSEDDLESLRWRLTKALRSGEQSIDNEALKTHLRQTVFDQINIDQPKYTGLRTCEMYERVES
jgi:aminoglycoside phosphotransferase (APT) family kinase protein